MTRRLYDAPDLSRYLRTIFFRPEIPDGKSVLELRVSEGTAYPRFLRVGLLSEGVLAAIERVTVSSKDCAPLAQVPLAHADIPLNIFECEPDDSSHILHGRTGTLVLIHGEMVDHDHGDGLPIDWAALEPDGVLEIELRVLRDKDVPYPTALCPRFALTVESTVDKLCGKWRVITPGRELFSLGDTSVRDYASRRHITGLE